MINIYNSKFLRLSYDKENKILKQYWSKKTVFLSEDEYKTEVLAYKEALKEIKAKKVLVDSRDFLYAIPKEIQIWLEKEIFPIIIIVGVEKYAMLINKKSHANDGKEYKTKGNLKIQCFKEEKEAVKWLAV